MNARYYLLAIMAVLVVGFGVVSVTPNATIEYATAEIVAIGTTIIGGAVAYAKARQKGESFEPEKFASSLAVGLVVGLVAYGTHQPFTSVLGAFGSWGLVNTIENAVKVVWRQHVRTE